MVLGLSTLQDLPPFMETAPQSLSIRNGLSQIFKNTKSDKSNAVSLLNPNISLSVHAGTSEANIILHLYQKVEKYTTCKRLFGKFYLFQQPASDYKKGFDQLSSVKFPGANGLRASYKGKASGRSLVQAESQAFT